MGCRRGTFRKRRCIWFHSSFLPHSVTLGAQSFPLGSFTLCIQCNSHAGPSWYPEFPAAQHDVLAPIPLDRSSCSLLMFRDNSCSSYPVAPVLPQFYLLYFLLPLLSFKHTAAYTQICLFCPKLTINTRSLKLQVMFLASKSSLLVGNRPESTHIPCCLLGTHYTS